MIGEEEIREARPAREPSLADALIPLVSLAVLIGGALALFGLDALDGPIQVALLVCAIVAALIAMKNGHPWEAVQQAGQGAMASITSAIFILLAVGALIGVWNLSGTIPTIDVETPVIAAMPTSPTPIVPAVVHELPMLIAIAPQINAEAA